MDAVIDAPRPNVAVVPARMQVSELTAGHRELLDWVVLNHDKVILFLGCSPIPNSRRDPLDFQSREWMIRELYPNVIIVPIMDTFSDELWSKELDERIKVLLGPGQTAALYGSRDGFMDHYTGKFPVVELVAGQSISGTEHRTEIGRTIRGSADWRAGVIWASQQRFPVSFCTVDVAIFNDDYSHIVLGKKPNEKDWRLPGGFTDPDGTDHENDARREAMEETTLAVERLFYIGSYPIDDWRYRNGPDKIKSLLYGGVGKGDLVAGDDLEVAEWIDLNSLGPAPKIFPTFVMNGHKELVMAAWFFARNMREQLPNREKVSA